MRAALLLPALALLAACASPPAVAGFNGDSVTVTSNAQVPDDQVRSEAIRICGTAGRTAEFASSRQMSAYANPNPWLPTYEHLFLCLDSNRGAVFPTQPGTMTVPSQATMVAPPATAIAVPNPAQPVIASPAQTGIQQPNVQQPGTQQPSVQQTPIRRIPAPGQQPARTQTAPGTWRIVR